MVWSVKEFDYDFMEYYIFQEKFVKVSYLLVFFIIYLYLCRFNFCSGMEK